MNAKTARLAAVVAAASLAVVGGCAKQPKPKPLTPQAFISPRATPAPAAAAAAPAAPARPAAPEVPTNSVAERVNAALNKPAAPAAAVNPPSAAVIDPPAPSPAATRAAVTIGASGGQYMTMGGIVADVNGTPIHASKVLSMLDPIFRQKARQLPPERFRREAAADIGRQINELIRAQLDYAIADRTLDPEDRRMADALTINWRLQQITQAGGSLELAKRASLAPADKEAPPMDFDERTAEQRRVELIRIYNQKKVVPRIQVSANDIREYYDRNVNLKFTQNERVKFRLIKVDIEKTDGKDKGKEKSIAKVADKYKRAKAGEDFKAMAMAENDEKLFAAEAPFDVAPSAFAIPKVVEALKKLNPGEVSEPVEDRTAFYVVKLEERVGGRVRPFDEQAVQDQIRAALRSEQYARLREQDFIRLTKDATITTNEKMASIALDMAMQRYAEYAAAK